MTSGNRAYLPPGDGTATPRAGGDNRPSTTALRQLGPQCRRCRNTEARCAYLSICCPDCTHWRNYDRNGEPVSDREHATERGWQQHRYRREVPCVACIHAHREHNSERKRTA